jgi:hypothetical protein
MGGAGGVGVQGFKLTQRALGRGEAIIDAFGPWSLFQVHK